MTGNGSMTRYVRPGWFTQHVFNPTVALLTRLGISVWGIARTARSAAARAVSGEPHRSTCSRRREPVPRCASRAHPMGPQHAGRARGRAPRRQEDRTVPRHEVADTDKVADPACLPEAVEGRGRRVLRRRERDLVRRGSPPDRTGPSGLPGPRPIVRRLTRSPRGHSPVVPSSSSRVASACPA